jgi:integrase
MTQHSEKLHIGSESMGIDNLTLRKGTYHVRVSVPPELRKSLGKTEITRSLKTGSKTEANLKKLPILEAIRLEIEKHRKASNPEKIYDLFETTHKFSLESEKEEHLTISEIMANGKTDEWYYKGFFINDLSEMLIKGFEKPLLKGNTKKPKRIEHESKITEKLEEWKNRWNETVTKKRKLSIGDQIEASSELNEIWNEKFIESLEFQGKKLTPVEKTTVKEIIADSKFFTPNTEFSDSRLEEFSEYQSKIRKVIQKTVDMQVSRLKTLRDFFTNNKLELNHKSVRTWLEKEQVLSAKTKKQYILAGNTFWKWALNNVSDFEDKYADTNPAFVGHEFPTIRKGKAGIVNKRKTYTDEQIELLYSKAKELTGKNRQPLLDAIMIGSHSGMRIEEICKIEINRDLIDDKGVYSFSLDEGKNERSIRNIPIHPALLPTIERMKKESKDGFLMPSPAGNKYDIRSDYLSKAFGRLKTSNGFGKQYVFHCFRNTVIEKLQHADVAPLTIISIVGHESGSTTFDIYGKGASADQKYKAILNINYNLS